LRRLVPAALVCAAAAFGQAAAEANAGYRTREGRAQVASNLEGPARDARQRPRELVAALGLKPGMTVVDWERASATCCRT